MQDKLKRLQIELDKAKETLGDELFFGLKQVEGSVMLDHSLFGYFGRCWLVNNILAKHNYFLRFYERRNKFRYQLRRKLKTKNEMRRELSSCIIQKFNGYELMRNKLQHKEISDFTPIDIVYEPTLDVKKPVLPAEPRQFSRQHD